MLVTATDACVQYLIPWAREGRARKETDDPELGRKLWAWMEEAVKDV